MVAYCNPEAMLVRRGLLRPRNERHTYDITDAGRAAIEKAERALADDGRVYPREPSHD
jgi:hypothetical protein